MGALHLWHARALYHWHVRALHFWRARASSIDRRHRRACADNGDARSQPTHDEEKMQKSAS